VAYVRDNDYETSGSIKGGQFFDWQGDYQLLHEVMWPE
jgi:hypothetical protein